MSQSINMKMQNVRFLAIVFFAASLLLIPFTAMQFTGEVKWNWFDFLVAGTLLVGTGAIIEVALRLFKSMKQRIVACAIIFAVLFVVWAELAVGILGTPLAGS